MRIAARFHPEGDPILGPIAGSAEQNHARRALHQGVHAFQDEWLRYEGDSDLWPSFNGGEVPLLGNIIASSITAPTPTRLLCSAPGSTRTTSAPTSSAT